MAKKDSGRAGRLGLIMLVTSMFLLAAGGYMIFIGSMKSNVASIRITEITPIISTFYVSPRAYYQGLGMALITIGLIPLILGAWIIVTVNMRSNLRQVGE